MTPGFAKPREELPWLPYGECSRVIINAHNFTPPAKGFGDELLILRGPTGVIDQSASGLTASYNGGMGVTADTSNNGVSAFLFDGTNDSITIPNTPILQVSPVLTLAMWLRIDAWPTAGNFAGIAGMWNPPGNQRGYSLYLDGNVSSNVNWQASKNGTVTAGQDSFTTQASYSAATWYLVIAEINAGAANLIRSGASQSGARSDATTIHPSTTFFGLGCHSNAGTPYRLFNGRMDDVRVFNRLLTSGEKADWLAAGRGYDA